jgi:hypothetical protein
LYFVGTPRRSRGFVDPGGSDLSEVEPVEIKRLRAVGRRATRFADSLVATRKSYERWRFIQNSGEFPK